MKCQILGNNKKKIMKLSYAEFADSLLNVIHLTERNLSHSEQPSEKSDVWSTCTEQRTKIGGTSEQSGQGLYCPLTNSTENCSEQQQPCQTIQIQTVRSLLLFASNLKKPLFS